MKKNTSKRMTRQRKKILEVLRNTDIHPTADWIYEQVKQDIPNISLGTIYRNLNVLANMGEIMALDYGSTYSRFDGNPENHYHFKCEECDQVYDLNQDILKDLQNNLEQLKEKIDHNTPFKVNYHRLEFYGICGKCQEKNRTE